MDDKSIKDHLEEVDGHLPKNARWFMTTTGNDTDKRCYCYMADGAVYFKNHDDKLYKINVSVFSHFLIDQ